MPTIPLSSDAELFYRVDDFSYPWETPPTVLLLHGNAESGVAWNRWMPHLTALFRVVRPDMRGFGQSTAMPLDHSWSLDELVGDFIHLADRLDIERFHLVAAKIGGPIALRLAATHSDRVRTLTVIGSPVSGRASLGKVHAEWMSHIERHGVESWARWTMPGRLGSNCSPETTEAWARLMGGTARSTQLGFIGAVPAIDVTADLPRVRCPTLVITTEKSGLGTVDATRAWQQTIRDSELLVLPGDSYHAAATAPDVCAGAVLDFIERQQATRR